MSGTPLKPLVFVVDDEKVIAATTEMILKRNGFVARAFTNPVDALNASLEDVPDLLVSDVVMPEMSGIDLALELTSKCPECKVLLFSGQAVTEDLLREARKQGKSFRLLPKPIHPSTLIDAIRQVIRADPGTLIA